MHEYRAEIVRVVDGDTIDARLDLGFYMSAELRLRLAGIDAPETRGPEREAGKAATAALVAKLAEDPGPCIVRTSKTGKYGRWLADIFSPSGLHLNNWLLEAGHANPARY